jgi:intein-encoded DNA endonuclease-like protein
MKTEELAYISGFLDGDGCITVQLVARKDYILGYQIRTSIIFYQSNKYVKYLEQIKAVFNTGYIRNRKDGMSEYNIVGYSAVKTVLELLNPYIRIKKEQSCLALEIICSIEKYNGKLKPLDLVNLAKKVDKFSELNYSKKRSITSDTVYKFLQQKQIL